MALLMFMCQYVIVTFVRFLDHQAKGLYIVWLVLGAVNKLSC